MLVESMTHSEVYRELERDRDTATTWWRHHLETLRRPVLKARQLPHDLFVARTFITYSMTAGLQAADFAAHRQHILTDREMYERAKEWYT